MWDPYAEFRTTTLPNGLTIHATQWQNRPWEHVGFLIHSGAEHDPNGREGVAHFVEHLVSHNTTMTKEEIEMYFEDQGGSVNLGLTDFASTKYFFYVPLEQSVLKKALSLFGEMLLSAQLDKNVEHERQVIIGEFSRSHPMQIFYDLQMRRRRALYAGTRFGRALQPLGAPETIQRITQVDLQSFYDEHYTSANLSIVGVGGLSLEQLVELVAESPLGKKKSGKHKPIPAPITSAEIPSEHRVMFRYSDYLTSETAPSVGNYESWIKIPGSVNRHALKMVAAVLEKVLMQEIRERRAWAYGVNCNSYNTRVFHEFVIQCKGLILASLDEIENVVNHSIKSLYTADDLFEHERKRKLAQDRMIDLRGGQLCVSAVKDLVYWNRIVPITEESFHEQQVTMHDIHQILEWMKPEQQWTLLMRP